MDVQFNQNILSRLFSLLGRKTRSALELCSLSFSIDQIVINCPDEAIADILYEYVEDISVSAYRAGFVDKIILVKLGSDTLYSLPTNTVFKIQSSTNFLIMTENQVLTLPDKELFRELDEYPRGAFVIRMQDHKALYCNRNILETTGTSPNDWIGQDLSRLWDRSELIRFSSELEKHKILTDSTYLS